ncbi:ABC transporter ATP-binding protein [Sulfurimonas sp.]|uniref:ABC transporter ATP-binding protein n=1 Tax=Sulfurimonas sp. TaxID=2022749 RepID=UPI002AB1E70A|nr:ABC transporter ATP-binding protein [Sulfurimonas sp.]
MIEISNITKEYGSLKALNNLSLRIKEKTVFGLLGVNGAGKSTLLSVLNGLVKIDSGFVKVFGLDLAYHKKEIKEMSSIIPQHLAFYENLSVKENLDFFSKIQKASKKNIDKAIEVNRLNELLNQKSSTLSGGQKRRLNIAIGLLNNPKIIYFDEPTVGLDPKSRNEILDSIKTYKDLGVSVVYTSHYMTEIERICDEVAIIDKGKLIKQDLLDNLLSDKLSDKILIEIIHSDKVNNLNFNITNDSMIETNKEELFSIIEKLDEHKINIKQIKYGASNLEKYFLEVT